MDPSYIRTKIVCTIGPAVATLEKMVALLHAGMNVARLNFSHGTHKEHAHNIALLKKARESLSLPLALMLDMQGPKIRVDQVQNGALALAPLQKIRLVEKGDGSPDAIPFHPFQVIDALKVGSRVLFDDGYIVGKVVEISSRAVVIQIENGGVLKSGKGVSLPGAILALPAMTKEDIEDLGFGCQHDVDFIAASFIRSADHILSIKELLASHGKSDIPVIAKIESTQGVENFDSIVQVADGIMVARGDLGVELDLATIPRLQKMMIRKCFQASKPVITATQMLESMITNPRPTRAEVSDVANAVYDGSSLVMLSAETAVGKYPVETVVQMKNIAREAESDFNYREFFETHSNRDTHDITSSIAMAAVKTAYNARAKAIFAITTSGGTARLVSRLRPLMPIIAVTSDLKHYHQLALSWGVTPVICPNCKSYESAFEAAKAFALEKGIIEFGDVVVVTMGSPFGKKGSTNTLIVEPIGEVLVRGHKGVGQKTTGDILIVHSSHQTGQNHVEGKILIFSHCDDSFLPLFKKAKGVILQNSIGDISSEKYVLALAKTFEIPAIVRADGALQTLKNGESVTLDPQKGLIY